MSILLLRISTWLRDGALFRREGHGAMGDGRWGCKWGGTMGTNGFQAAARGAAFNLIVLRNNRDRDQWYSIVILHLY